MNPKPQRTPSVPPGVQALQAALDVDAYKPAQIAERVETLGVSKARLPPLQTVTLGLLGGAFVAFGGMFYLVAITDSLLGFGPTRVVGGLAFSLGLVLVLVGGAELFTGSSLMVMACVERRIGWAELARNWTIVYVANAAGGIGAATLFFLAGPAAGQVGDTLAHVAQGKVALSATAALARGLLCNALVCLGVWLSLAARDIAGRILAIALPVSAFVALGFEHSIANLFFLPLALLETVEGVTPAGVLHNLLWVTAGNVIGGAGFVGLVYWLCYRQPN